MDAKTAIFIALGLVTTVYVVLWTIAARDQGMRLPKPLEIAIGFVTNFFDTLGIGSFAPTTAMFKFWRLVPDERIPGTLNVGDALPTIAEAFIFIAIVQVDVKTLILLILAAIAGAWLGAGIVSKLSRRAVQIGMGGALLVAATLFIMKNLSLIPGGGVALGLEGALLAVGIIVNFALGAFMTLGIGLYAPSLISISLLGMNPLAAFPIMMGSCAFLMPVAGQRFIKFNRYELRTALGLTLGGIPGVLIAAFIVKSLPLFWVRWLVVVVVLYAAIVMLRSALGRRDPRPLAPVLP
ncbi:MAG: TSUP family transporter [Candidatus Baltobacteraceae bacterium]